MVSKQNKDEFGQDYELSIPKVNKLVKTSKMKKNSQQTEAKKVNTQQLLDEHCSKKIIIE